MTSKIILRKEEHGKASRGLSHFKREKEERKGEEGSQSELLTYSGGMAITKERLLEIPYH